MGLRINSNQNLLNQLRLTDRQFTSGLAKLASGKSIQSAADNPAGLVIGEQLRAQLASLNQALNNTDRGIHMINTADAGLEGAASALRELRGQIVAGLGAQSSGERSAIQQQVDALVGSIDRIGATTRFAGQDLLNGQSALQTSGVDAAFTNINVSQASFNGAGDLTFQLDVTAAATQGSGNIAAAGGNVVAAGGDVTLSIQGPNGGATFTLAQGATADDFLAAANLYSQQTGVEVTNTGTVDANTLDYGSAQSFTITQIGGSGNFAPGTVTGSGTDLQGSLNGQTIAANGNQASFNNGGNVIDFTVADGTGAGSYNFTVSNGSGLTFQTNVNAQPSDSTTVGIGSLSSATLGFAPRTLGGQTVGGALSSITSGGANDLSSNPENALRIVDEAISQVSRQRAGLGAVSDNVLSSNLDSLGVAIGELTASQSSIFDLDYAKQVSENTRQQFLLQAGLFALQNNNLSARSVLSLLR